MVALIVGDVVLIVAGAVAGAVGSYLFLRANPKKAALVAAQVNALDSKIDSLVAKVEGLIKK